MTVECVQKMRKFLHLHKPSTRESQNEHFILLKRLKILWCPVLVISVICTADR